MEKSKDLPFVLDFCPEIQLENPSRWRISGHSKAGKRTGLFLKPMKIVLDAGLGTLQKPAAIMLTHSHYDHTLALPTLVSRFNSPLKGQEHLCRRPVFMPRGKGFKVQMMKQVLIIKQISGSYQFAVFRDSWKIRLMVETLNPKILSQHRVTRVWLCHQ